MRGESSREGLPETFRDYGGLCGLAWDRAEYSVRGYILDKVVVAKLDILVASWIFFWAA